MCVTNWLKSLAAVSRRNLHRRRRSALWRTQGGGVASSASLERLESRILLSAGDLDYTFSSDGKATINIGTGSDLGYGVAVQSDGKVVVVGDAFRTSGTSDFGIARLATNGSLDSSFSGDGFTTVSFASGSFDDFHARAVALQSDGKIVVVGYTRNSSNSDEDFAIARLNADGSMDNSFSSDGKTTVYLDLGGSAANNQDEALCVAIQPFDGKIVVGGYARTGATTQRFAVARLNADGSLDSSFGKQAFPSGSGSNDYAAGVAIQSDGKIVVAGTSSINTTNGYHELAVIRLSTTGTLDSSFSGDGRATFSTDPVGPTGADGNAVALQSDGKIVVAGRGFRSSGNDDFLVVRFNTNGTLDSSLQGSGFRMIAFDKGPSDNSSRRDVAYGVAIQPNGKIVVAGEANTNNTSGVPRDFAIARISSDGSNDPTFFDGTGRRTVSFDVGGSLVDEARSVALAPDGKIVVAGRVDISSTAIQFGVIRLETNPNTAPVLNNSGNPYLIAPVGSRLDALTLQGTLVSALLATGAGGNPISDPDFGAQSGIALTGIDQTFGIWQFTLAANPTTPGDWAEFAFETISNTHAFLLPANARLRLLSSLTPHHAAGAPFLPLESKLAAGLTFRAWDRTTGNAGEFADTSSNGGTTAFSSATETAATYFEARLFRSFNSVAALDYYTLEAEFNAITANVLIQDRSTSGFTGFTVFLSPIPGVPTVPLYRLYYGIQFNSDGTETDMGYRYLTTSLVEATFLEGLGPADKRSQRDGTYFREQGVNNGTAILGYIYSAAQTGTFEMSQVYRLDDVDKPTRQGTAQVGPRRQQNGDHVYTTKSSVEMAKTGSWRQEASRGFVRELSPTAAAVAAPAIAAPAVSLAAVATPAESVVTLGQECAIAAWSARPTADISAAPWPAIVLLSQFGATDSGPLLDQPVNPPDAAHTRAISSSDVATARDFASLDDAFAALPVARP